jgi:hypothetical protein
MSRFLVTWFMLRCIVLATELQCPSHQHPSMKLTITSERNSTGQWIAKVRNNSNFEGQYTIFPLKTTTYLSPENESILLYSVSFSLFRQHLICLLLCTIVFTSTHSPFCTLLFPLLLTLLLPSLLPSPSYSSVFLFLFCLFSFRFLFCLKVRVYG